MDTIYSTLKPQAKITVGTTATQLPTVSGSKIIITLDDANSGKIFFGDATVTTAGAGNVFLKLGAASNPIILPIGQANLLWAVGSAASQVFYVGMIA
jgi:hypothetical protein